MKEKIQEEDVKSELSVENMNLKTQCTILTEEAESSRKCLTQANQELENLNLSFQDKKSEILELQSSQAVKESILAELKERTRRLEEINFSLETEKSGLSSQLSESHLKVKALEAKERDLHKFLEVSENQEIFLKELQKQLICTQAKWEDLKAREDLATGQVIILQRDLTEAKDAQSSLNREIKELQARVMETSIKNSELEMFGESRRSKETIERILAEKTNEESHHRDELSRLLKQRDENEESLRNVRKEAEKKQFLLEKSESNEATLQAELKAVQEKLQRNQNEMNEVQASHALQISTTANLLTEAERQASESCRQAASIAREKVMAALEHKYELMLMTANNENKRLEKKLGDAEHRSLTMSAELAKLKGKPNLGGSSSSSEQNKQVPKYIQTKKRSQTRPEIGPDHVENEQMGTGPMKVPITQGTGDKKDEASSSKYNGQKKLTGVGQHKASDAPSDVKPEAQNSQCVSTRPREGASISETKDLKSSVSLRTSTHKTSSETRAIRKLHMKRKCNQ